MTRKKNGDKLNLQAEIGRLIESENDQKRWEEKDQVPQSCRLEAQWSNSNVNASEIINITLMLKLF